MRSFIQSERYTVFLQILASKYISNIIIIFEYNMFWYTYIYIYNFAEYILRSKIS